MLTAGRRGNEENLCASVRLFSTFLACPCSSGVCWPPAGRFFTASSIEMLTAPGSNIRSGGPFVFWGGWMRCYFNQTTSGEQTLKSTQSLLQTA